MRSNPIIAIIIISIIGNIYINSSDRSSTTLTIVVIKINMNIKFIINYLISYQY